MEFVANKDIPALKARKGQTIELSPYRGRLMMQQGLVRRAGDPVPAVAAEKAARPAPLAGSRTGRGKPASSSGPAPAPRTRRSKGSAATPTS